MCFRLLVDRHNVTHVSGFASDTDAVDPDINLWLPHDNVSMSVKTAEYIIGHVYGIFCNMLKQEKRTISGIDVRGKLACYVNYIFLCQCCDTNYWVAGRVSGL